MRLAELVKLDVDHVNLEEGYAKVYGKGRRERIVPVGVELRHANIRDLHHYVECKLNHYGPHTLRHTSITFRLRKTRDLKTTSLISGHSTTRTTERYVHLTGRRCAA